MLALLIGVQFFTRGLSQFLTGSLVNLILLISVFMMGLGGGLTVAVLSPFLAFIAGIGPAFIQIVPITAVGNTILVLIANLVRNRVGESNLRDLIFTAAGILTAGIAKTLFLWLGITVIALPMIPGLGEAQRNVISTAFSWPQLVTAIIGGTIAMAVAPLLKLALRRTEG
jgi:hypothetical protein